VLERTTIEGKKAFVGYMDDEFNLVPKADATMIKVMFDSGDSVICHVVNEEKYAEDDAHWEESKHPRGQPGNAGQFGPGSGGGKKAEPTSAKTNGSGEHPGRGKRHVD
jgi:hypothetical protein